MSTDEFVRRVRRATEGTPYVVTRTARGFDLALGLGDDTWRELLRKRGLRQRVVHHVRVDGDRYSVTDDIREVHWEAGTPRVAAGRFRGRIVPFGEHRSTWALEDDGTVRHLGGFRFDTREGRDLVTLVGDDLGLQQRRGLEERIGLYAALSVPACLAVIGLVILMDWLL